MFLYHSFSNVLMKSNGTKYKSDIMDLEKLEKKCKKFLRKDVSDLEKALTEEEKKHVYGYSDGHGGWNMDDEDEMTWFHNDIITSVAIDKHSKKIYITSVFAG